MATILQYFEIESVIKISLKFVPGSPIDNDSALAQVMAWHSTGNKPNYLNPC